MLTANKQKTARGVKTTVQPRQRIDACVHCTRTRRQVAALVGRWRTQCFLVDICIILLDHYFHVMEEAIAGRLVQHARFRSWDAHNHQHNQFARHDFRPAGGVLVRVQRLVGLGRRSHSLMPAKTWQLYLSLEAFEQP